MRCDRDCMLTSTMMPIVSSHDGMLRWPAALVLPVGDFAAVAGASSPSSSNSASISSKPSSSAASTSASADTSRSGAAAAASTGRSSFRSSPLRPRPRRLRRGRRFFGRTSASSSAPSSDSSATWSSSARATAAFSSRSAGWRAAVVLRSSVSVSTSSAAGAPVDVCSAARDTSAIFSACSSGEPKIRCQRLMLPLCGGFSFAATGSAGCGGGEGATGRGGGVTGGAAAATSSSTGGSGSRGGATGLLGRAGRDRLRGEAGGVGSAGAGGGLASLAAGFSGCVSRATSGAGCGGARPRSLARLSQPDSLRLGGAGSGLAGLGGGGAAAGFAAAGCCSSAAGTSAPNSRASSSQFEPLSLFSMFKSSSIRCVDRRPRGPRVMLIWRTHPQYSALVAPRKAGPTRRTPPACRPAIWPHSGERYSDIRCKFVHDRRRLLSAGQTGRDCQPPGAGRPGRVRRADGTVQSPRQSARIFVGAWFFAA